MINFGKIGFVGGGNMGSCLIGGLLKKNITPDNIVVADQSPQTCQVLAQKWGINTTTEPNEIVSLVDILVLAVKPQQMKALLEHIAPSYNPAKTLVISIAAGITTSQIKRWLQQNDCQVVRAMPNTPALLGQGITGLYASEQVSLLGKQQADNLLNTVGETVWLNEESLMDVVTALSGSGPAYFFYIMEALLKGAISLGLAPEIASKLALQTALGSAAMAMHAAPDEDVASLRAKVSSPGGTTEAGIKVLKDGKLEDLILKTLINATERGKELSQQFD